MIGVIARPGQEPVIEEFFELFKTPWEFYHYGRAYDVVIATADAAPNPQPALFISFGATRKESDQRIAVAGHHPGGTVQDADVVPIYTGLLAFGDGAHLAPCLQADVGTVGLQSLSRDGEKTLRIGYDLFEETRFLLSTGQPVQYAGIPALDLHIAMLRRWILAAGIPVLEIAAAPAGHDFAVCLTHDIDFIGIRQHKFDHTMFGFLYRSTVAGTIRALKGRLSARRLLAMWRAAASLPFVYLGWVKDFWEPFEWYLEAERHLPATYYLIPFKGRAGDGATARRAAAYGAADIEDSVRKLVAHGCEVGVHGIDAWHDAGKGREELARIRAVAGDGAVGVRMHWLMQDARTPAVLERAGFAYDSTSGYNETIGYRNGTTQVFRPLGAHTLLELPMHVQDGALFYPRRLDLSEAEAASRCRGFIDRARALGGALTIIWHDRSHGPERFWGDFYLWLVDTLKSTNAWFGTARDVVEWFQQRRAVHFEPVHTAHGASIRIRHHGHAIQPPLNVVVHRPSGAGATATPWTGELPVEFTLSHHRQQQPAGA